MLEVRDADDGETDDKIVTEDGAEFVHRAAGNLAEKKRGETIKEKIEVHLPVFHIHENL